MLCNCSALCLTTLIIAARLLHLCACFNCTSVHASTLHPLLAHYHLCYVDLYQGSPTWCSRQQVARKDHVCRPRACFKNNISMISIFTLTNINNKIIEGKLSKIFISEMWIKLVTLRINRYKVARSFKKAGNLWSTLCMHYKTIALTFLKIILFPTLLCIISVICVNIFVTLFFLHTLFLCELYAWFFPITWFNGSLFLGSLLPFWVIQYSWVCLVFMCYIYEIWLYPAIGCPKWYFGEQQGAKIKEIN